jgi:uncharacterized damage-inducible protein DinB
MSIDRLFLDFSATKLEQLYGRIVDCFGRLTPEQVWARGSENTNAAGNLALHLSGNVRQWIVAGIGGARDTRERDSEFAERTVVAPAELLERLRSTLDEALRVIRGLSAARLGETVVIQNYRVTVLEAVYHVVEHFAQHTAQIILITKALTGEDLGFYAHLSRAASHDEAMP